MIVLGLTGSIGMGKSTTANMFRERNILVYDADAAVHELYEAGGAAVGPLSERFPEAHKNGGIDRAILRDLVVGKPEAMSDLEAIVHPLVGQTQLAFRQSALEAKALFVVLDIPLLYETGGDQRCDYVAVVTAPASVQRERVLSRGAMDEAEFETILAKQMSDADKRAKADFVISTAFGLSFTESHVEAIIALMTELATETP
ncbi:dephospho-CoA kinase [Hyphomonas sp. FCG-A18]|uniref:dephospho-CoA kinase n=1 Tax=Hyphomonas sp. FCG-A18 TaxID=3080019 RepID=UPI002B2D766D|nr:dephospho-CoA kinase [Hyphomonas sp. FCG-A18]